MFAHPAETNQLEMWLCDIAVGNFGGVHFTLIGQVFVFSSWLLVPVPSWISGTQIFTLEHSYLTFRFYARPRKMLGFLAPAGDKTVQYWGHPPLGLRHPML